MKKLFILFTCLLIYFLIPWNAGAQATEWSFASSWAFEKTTVPDPGLATGYNANNTYVIFDGAADLGCYAVFLQYADGNPHLSIPPGTIVKGVEVSLEGYRDAGSDRQFIVTLFYRWTGGSSITAERRTTDLDGSDVAHILGSATDSWGLWSAQHVAISSLEVNVSVSGTTGTAYLDHIKVRVHYGMPVSPLVVTTPGEFIVPAGVSSLTAKAWGGGGGGSSYSVGYALYGCGGGGGGYAGGTFAVNPADQVDIVVGAGGKGAKFPYNTAGVSGNPSKVTSGSNALTAFGGQQGGWSPDGNYFYPGAGGSGSSAGTVTNTNFFTGGNGVTGSAGVGGGGGGGAGDAANGADASGSYGGAGGNNSGGNGGDGTTGAGAGGNGSNYGGGGAGASNNTANEGGRGGDGVVILSWLAPCPGAAVSVYSESSITNSTNILGQPDGAVATLDFATGGEIVLDLTGEKILAPGTTITMKWRKIEGKGDPEVEIDLANEITGNNDIVVDKYLVTNTTLSEYSFEVVADTRYLLLYLNGTEDAVLEIDAVMYTCACPAPTPSVNVVNHCGYTVLTASDYTGDLTWSTGATTASIIVFTPGKYSVSQKVGDCLSLSGWATAAPYTIPANPGTITGPTNPCNSADAVYSISAVSGATGYIWTVPSGWTIKSGENTVSITVTAGTSAGNISVKATTATCESPASSVLAVSPDLACCTTTAADRYEPNNTIQTATALTLGGSLIWANILNPKDADWFSFLTAGAGSYTINLAGAGESLALYNDLGRKLKATDRTGTTYNLLASTPYYIKVSSRLKAPTACYSLGVQFVAAKVIVVEDYEVLTSVEVKAISGEAFKIWPNPSNSEFSFYNGMNFPVQLRISDFAGRTVEIIANTGPAQIARFGRNYPSGVYFVEATGDGIKKILKVVKQ